MTFGASGAALAGLAVAAGGAYAANQQSKAANGAAGAQTAADQAAIAEQQRQFDAIQKLLAPFVTGGTKALTSQQDMLGLNGAPAQQQAITALQSSPYFTAMQQQGTNSILANASATGGLRGGNTQAALAQFTPTLLAQAFQQQYGNLSGLSSQGQNAAAMTGNFGANASNNVSGLLQAQGAAQAGNALAQGKSQIAFGNSLLSGFTTALGYGGGF